MQLKCSFLHVLQYIQFLAFHFGLKKENMFENETVFHLLLESKKLFIWFSLL